MEIISKIKSAKHFYIVVTWEFYEQSFSKLELIKYYFRSSTNQNGLNRLSIISIENPVANDYDDIINDFTAKNLAK